MSKITPPRATPFISLFVSIYKTRPAELGLMFASDPPFDWLSIPRTAPARLFAYAYAN